MPFQAKLFQPAMLQGEATSPKRASTRVPFPPARPFLTLTGSVVGRVESPIRRVQSGRLTLRVRVVDDVSVLVQRRALSRWVETVYVGRDFQHLLPSARGEDFRLVVLGSSSGVVELVEEYRRLP